MIKQEPRCNICGSLNRVGRLRAIRGIEVCEKRLLCVSCREKWRIKNDPKFVELELVRRHNKKGSRDIWYSEFGAQYAREWRSKNPSYRTRALVGLSLAEYTERVNKQGGLCAICSGTSARGLVVDHDHRTNQFRGLICHRCNTAIGMMGDDPGVAYMVGNYLRAGGDYV